MPAAQPAAPPWHALTLLYCFLPTCPLSITPGPVGLDAGCCRPACCCLPLTIHCCCHPIITTQGMLDSILGAAPGTSGSAAASFKPDYNAVRQRTQTAVGATGLLAMLCSSLP